MSRKEHVKKLIIENNRRLEKLEEQQAQFGISADPHILIQIEDIEVKLEKLKTELRELEIDPQTLPKQNHDLNDSNKELGSIQKTVPPLAQFIANLLVLGILTYLFYGKVVVGCESNWVSAFSSAIITIVVFHIVWHYLYPVFTLSGKFSLFGFAINLKSFSNQLERLHPRHLPVFILWGVAIVLILSASIIGFTNLSPFVLEDPIPIIENFTVTYSNKQKSVVLAGDTIEIVPDEQILIEATVSQQSGLQCKWFTSNGKLQAATACAILYSPKFDIKHDTLVVLMQSLCQEKQTFAGVHISVIQTLAP